MPSQATFKRRQYLTRMKRKGSIACGICNQKIFSEIDLTIDHIIPKSKGGSNRVSNLQPAHKLCNEIKGSELPPLTEKEREYETIIDVVSNVGFTVPDIRSIPSRKAARLNKHEARAYKGRSDPRYTARRGYNWRQSTENRRRKDITTYGDE